MDATPITTAIFDAEFAAGAITTHNWVTRLFDGLMSPAGYRCNVHVFRNGMWPMAAQFDTPDLPTAEQVKLVAKKLLTNDGAAGR
jgi:hypothetical protein